MLKSHQFSDKLSYRDNPWYTHNKSHISSHRKQNIIPSISLPITSFKPISTIFWTKPQLLIIVDWHSPIKIHKITLKSMTSHFSVLLPIFSEQKSHGFSDRNTDWFRGVLEDHKTRLEQAIQSVFFMAFFIGFNGDTIGIQWWFNGDLMGFNGDLMGFNHYFYGDLRGWFTLYTMGDFSS